MLIWLHAFSDSLIALAYFLIPVALIYFVRRRRDAPFRWMFVCFGGFIAACGATHVMEVWTLWVPSYWFSAGIKVITAIASVPTALFLVRLMPKMLSLPSHEEIKEANDELKRQITARKEVETVLRESEDRYRDLVEHSTDLICTHNLEGRLMSVNELPIKLLGYTRDELLNKPMQDFLLPEAHDQFSQYLSNIKSTGFDKGLLVVLTKAGERRIWEYHNTLRTDGVAAPIVRGIAHDVTDQKRAEKALRLSEEKFCKAFRSSPVEVAITTLEEGRFLEVNESFERCNGYTRDEVLGRTSLELGIWQKAEDRAAVIQQVKKFGRSHDLEVCLRSKSGRRRVKRYSAEQIEIAGQRCLLTVCTDITFQKQLSEGWRLSEEKFSKAFRNSPSIIWISTLRDGIFVEVNESFENHTGYVRNELIGHSARGIGLWVDSSVEAALQRSIEERGRVRDQEIHLRGKSGQIVVVEMSVERIEFGGESYLLTVGQNITERKRAEDELRDLSGRLLRSQDDERRRIARDLHDSTGQNLVALTTMLSQLKTSIPSAQYKSRKLLSESKALADKCLSEVRTLSYVLHPPVLEEVGLEHAIRDYVRGFTKRSGIEVQLEVSSLIGRMTQDVELALFRIVQESLTNIHRHSGSPVAKIKIDRDSGFVLEISDIGSAAPPLARANGELRHETGVGIRSMQERVKLIGGRLDVDLSSHGATVRVTIPRGEDKHEKTAHFDC